MREGSPELHWDRAELAVGVGWGQGHAVHPPVLAQPSLAPPDPAALPAPSQECETCSPVTSPTASAVLYISPGYFFQPRNSGSITCCGILLSSALVTMLHRLASQEQAPADALRA